MKKILSTVLLLILSSILVVTFPQKKYSIEAFDGQYVSFNLQIDDKWPITFGALLNKNDAIKININDYDTLINSLYSKAKFTPNYSLAIGDAIRLIFNDSVTDCDNLANDLNMEYNYMLSKFETSLTFPIDSGVICVDFFNLQAIVLKSSKNDIGGVNLSIGIDNEMIPDTIFTPIVILKGEKTNLLQLEI